MSEPEAHPYQAQFFVLEGIEEQLQKRSVNSVFGPAITCENFGQCLTLADPPRTGGTSLQEFQAALGELREKGPEAEADAKARILALVGRARAKIATLSQPQ